MSTTQFPKLTYADLERLPPSRNEHNVYRPDVLYRADLVAYHLGHRHERGPVKRDWPVLLIDMLEPPNDAPDPRRLDAYARAGTPYYWVVDAQVPSVTLLELVSGVFVETAVVGGYDVLAVEDPFPIELCPGDQMV